MASTVAVARASGGDLAALKKGCEAGKAEDCTSLGLMYWVGDGVERNWAIATSFFKKAREVNKPNAQRAL